MKESIARGDFEFRAFISYASEDAAIVMPFVERLKADGISVWIDAEVMRGGPAVLDQLGEGLELSAYTVVCVTDAYLSSNYAMAELDVSQHRDLDEGSARTIPVKFQPMRRDLPMFMRPLTRCDLSDPTKFDREYARLKRSIMEPVARPSAWVDAESVAQTCAAPFEHRDEPEVALFLIRQAGAALDRYLYGRELGMPNEGTSRKVLHEALIASGRIPPSIAGSLALVRTFGDAVVNDQPHSVEVATRESIDHALAELRVLRAYAFPDRPMDDRTKRVVAAMSPIGDSRERQIAGTRLRFQEDSTDRTGLGPLYLGRDTATGEPRSVNLVDLPSDAEATFLDVAAQYSEVDAPELLIPAAAGIVEAGNGQRCPYVAFPLIRDISARELAAHHNGKLPIGPVYEIGLGVANALAQLPSSLPPSRLSAHDVRLSRFGVVHLLALGLPADINNDTDRRGLAALLRELLTGIEPPHAPTGDVSAAAETLRQVAACRSAAQLLRVLKRAKDALPDNEPSLRSLMPATTAPTPTWPRPDLDLIESYRLKSLRAWPLGDGRVLAWETETERLAVMDGPQPQWRDDEATPIRLAVTGRNGRVAVGGWNGAVRYFSDGELVAKTSLDGTVGDLAFAGDELIAGSWRHGLERLTVGHAPQPLLEVASGVHRIAMARGGDRFAVADLSGRLAIYASYQRINDWRDVGIVADLAYAGARLVLLTTEGLKGLRLDGTISGPRERSGAMRLLSDTGDDTCILLVAADPRGPMAPLEAWTINQEDVHLHRATFPAGSRVLSTCAVHGRFTVALPGGGCAYWHNGAERQLWPTARAAELARDGGQVVVALPDRVELYATTE